MENTTDRGTKQFSTFYVAGRLYGIDVMRVQEIVKSMPMTKVPLAPAYVHGLINLRGQIATAVGLKGLFGLDGSVTGEEMNVVCQFEGALVSLLVDRIGDVIEVEDSLFESVPETLSESVKKFMGGVYKTSGPILSVIEIEKVCKALIQSKVKE